MAAAEDTSASLISASQPTATAPAPAETPPESQRLTGEWGGARTWLTDHGLEVSLSLTTIYQHNAHGGANTHHAHDISGSTDLELHANLETMHLVPGGRLYAHAESSWGEGIGADVGDLFGVNTDAAGNRSIDLTELWYEQTLWDGALRFRAGKMDLATDFDTNAYANDETMQFLNGALVNGANIPFPAFGLGLQAIARTELFYGGAAVVDAEADTRETGFRTALHGADTFFSMYEAGVTPAFKGPRGDLTGSYRFGLWYDPQPKEQFFNDLDGRRRTVPMRTDDVGFYLSCDQLVFKERADEGDSQGLGLFCRYGYAHADVNTLEHVWSLGAQYAGLLPDRDGDVLALGVAQGVLSRELAKTGITPRRETAIELYYSVRVFGWMTITPDFQWVLDPGGTSERDSFVAGLRVQTSF